MGKIKNPVIFSSHFRIDPLVLERAGAVDPTLNVDLRLFIDPLLLPQSRASQMKTDATMRIRNHFEKIVTLLEASRREDDIAWRQARRLMS